MFRLFQEWWVQVWPNLAASALTFSGGYLWARRSLLVKLEQKELSHLQRHKELRLMVEKVLATQAATLEAACGNAVGAPTVVTEKGADSDHLRT